MVRPITWKWRSDSDFDRQPRNPIMSSKATGSRPPGIIFGILLLLGPALSIAQVSGEDLAHPNISYDLQLHGGRTLVNAEFPGTLTFARLLSCNIGFQTTGRRPWHRSFRFPQYGFTILAGDQGNRDILGPFVAIIPNITFFNKRNRNWYLYYSNGMGLAYFRKPYHKTDNPDNVLIGSALTNGTFHHLSLKKRGSPHWFPGIGLSWFHFSNGQVQVPNLGSNIFTLNLSAQFYPRKKPLDFRVIPPDTIRRKMNYTIRLGLGLHEYARSTLPGGGPKFPVYTTSFYVGRRFGLIHDLHVGFHMHYYTSYYDYIISQELFDRQERLRSSNWVIFIGDELKMGRFSVIAQAGVNLYNPFRVAIKGIPVNQLGLLPWLTLMTCNKYGIQYYPLYNNTTKATRLYLGLYIKADLTLADFVEWGFGYNF